MLKPPKKLFDYAAFAMLIALAVSWLPSLGTAIYHDAVYYHDYNFLLDFFLPQFLQSVIVFCVLSLVLFIGLLCKKRGVILAGLIVQSCFYGLAFFASLYSYLNNASLDGQGLRALTFLIPFFYYLVLIGFYVLLGLHLFKGKQLSPALDRVVFYLPVVAVVLTTVVELFNPPLLPPLSLLSKLATLTAYLLLAGAITHPARFRLTQQSKTLGKAGLISLLAGLGVSVCILVVSLAVYGQVYFYNGYEFTALLWILVYLAVIFGMITTPSYLFCWLREHFAADGLAPSRQAPYYGPQTQPSVAQQVQRPVARQPYAPPAQPVYAPSSQPVYAPSVQPVYTPPTQPTYAPPVYTPPAGNGQDLQTQLRQLKQLQEEGLITQEDYDAKKNQLLKL